MQGKFTLPCYQSQYCPLFSWDCWEPSQTSYVLAERPKYCKCSSAALTQGCGAGSPPPGSINIRAFFFSQTNDVTGHKNGDCSFLKQGWRFYTDRGRMGSKRGWCLEIQLNSNTGNLVTKPSTADSHQTFFRACSYADSDI